MSATDDLRRMLDERGVEWKEHRHTVPGSMAIQRETLWGQPIDNTNGKPIPHVYHNRATEMGDGRLFLEAQLVTPEQAIAATLGQGKCQLTDNGPWGYPYVCSACGASYDPDILNGDWNFCPNCGRKVVDE